MQFTAPPMAARDRQATLLLAHGLSVHSRGCSLGNAGSMTPPSDDVPIACSLDERALAGRTAALRASVLAQADRLERLPDGYRWFFGVEPDIFARLGPILDAERRCCRFLRIALSADPGLGVVALTVTGPAGTADFLEAWLPPPPH